MSSTYEHAGLTTRIPDERILPATIGSGGHCASIGILLTRTKEYPTEPPDIDRFRQIRINSDFGSREREAKERKEKD